jgi:hypothetical protein
LLSPAPTVASTWAALRSAMVWRFCASRELDAAFFAGTAADSAARTFFTSTWTAQFGPISADLLVISFTLGPVGLHVSLLSLITVLVAYLIARSLF